MESSGIPLIFQQATVDNLEYSLCCGGGLLHLSCHGLLFKEPNPSTWLLLEDSNCGAHALKTDESFEARLQDCLDARNELNKLKCVSIGACHSRSAGECFANAGVSHVMCSRSDELQLMDCAVIAFNSRFYGELARGVTIKAAFDSAKQVVRDSLDVQDTIRCLSRQQKISRIALSCSPRMVQTTTSLFFHL
jgi:hypothetical protein